MDISRKLGILVVMGVPVIVGGGIVYGLFGNYIALAAWEVIVAAAAGAVVSQ